MINNEELRQKYNPEGSELRLLQYKMLDELTFLDKICKENNIPYTLVCGSVLGAIRHKGFIPWDDDADIALLEKDYKKLINPTSFLLACNYLYYNFLRFWNCKFVKYRL